MKYKYYLRGLGMGIFVTALILSIAHHSTERISARELAEETAGQASETLSAAVSQEEEKPADSAEGTEPVDEAAVIPDGTNAASGGDAQDSSPAPSVAQNATPKEEPAEEAFEADFPAGQESLSGTAAPADAEAVNASSVPDPAGAAGPRSAVEAESGEAAVLPGQDKETGAPAAGSEAAAAEKPAGDEAAAEKPVAAEKPAAPAKPVGGEAAAAEKPAGDEAAAEEKPVTPEASAAAEQAESSAGMLSITISRGSGSDTVARLLQQAGAVESAADFDRYLCSNGYDKRIHTGVRQIPAGASYSEIARIITSGD